MGRSRSTTLYVYQRVTQEYLEMTPGGPDGSGALQCGSPPTRKLEPVMQCHLFPIPGTLV